MGRGGAVHCRMGVARDQVRIAHVAEGGDSWDLSGWVGFGVVDESLGGGKGRVGRAVELCERSDGPFAVVGRHFLECWGRSRSC